jgi:hypothetical protein
MSIADLITVCLSRNAGIPILLTEFMHQYTLYPRTLIYVPPFFMLVRVYVCAFVAMSVHTSLFLYSSLTDALTPL